MVRYSKRLPQGNKDLGRLDSCNRIKVATDIESNRAHRCGISGADADGVCIVLAKLMEADRTEHISTIIKCRETQALLERYGNSDFRVENQQLSPALRNADK